jgi:hypothetical protein
LFYIWVIGQFELENFILPLSSDEKSIPYLNFAQGVLNFKALCVAKIEQGLKNSCFIEKTCGQVNRGKLVLKKPLSSPEFECICRLKFPAQQILRS